MQKLYKMTLYHTKKKTLIKWLLTKQKPYKKTVCYKMTANLDKVYKTTVYQAKTFKMTMVSKFG